MAAFQQAKQWLQELYPTQYDEIAATIGGKKGINNIIGNLYDFTKPAFRAAVDVATMSADASDGAPPRKKAKISYTDVHLCKTLARWGRGAAQKKMMPTFDTSAGPSSSQPPGVKEGASIPQTASSSAPKELDTESVVHVQSSPIADLEREKIFVRACYKDIFARIWRLIQLWIQCRKAKLATRESDTETAQKAVPQAEQEEGNWRFTLTGLPGVGKSVWILYAVAMFFQQKEIKSVFLQQRDTSVTHQFTRDGIIKHLKPAVHIPELTDEETALDNVLIFDGMKPQMVDIRSPVILVTSPRLDLSQEFTKGRPPEEYNMPMWDLPELQAADAHEPKGGASIEAVIAIYGPKARHCLPAGKRTVSRDVLEKALDRKDVPIVIEALSRGRLRFQGDKGSHVLVGYSLDGDYRVVRMFYVSDVARDACIQWMEDEHWTGFNRKSMTRV